MAKKKLKESDFCNAATWVAYKHINSFSFASTLPGLVKMFQRYRSGSAAQVLDARESIEVELAEYLRVRAEHSLSISIKEDINTKIASFYQDVADLFVEEVDWLEISRQITFDLGLIDE